MQNGELALSPTAWQRVKPALLPPTDQQQPGPDAQSGFMSLAFRLAET